MGAFIQLLRKTYDKSIGYLSSAIEGAEIQKEDQVQSLKNSRLFALECLTPELRLLQAINWNTIN